MIKLFKKLFKQYVTCKHENKKVLKKIMCPSESIKIKWMEKFECVDCKRKTYGGYFFEYGSERHYID